MDEIEEKLSRCRTLIKQRGWDGLALTQQANFAWITGGVDNRVVLASDMGAATILVTHDTAYYITNEIEAPRLAEFMDPLPFEPVYYPWYEPTQGLKQIQRIINGKRWASDAGEQDSEPIAASLQPLQRPLTPSECKKYRELGKEASSIVTQTCHQIKRGISEHGIAGMITNELMRAGIQPYVILVAADDHVRRFRHPLPTEQPIQTYAMIVVCARRYGLIANFTRFVAFDSLSGELEKKFNAVATIDTRMNIEAQPHRTYAELFQRTQQAYADVGYPVEWKLHHQGGPTGYQGRYFMMDASQHIPILPTEAVAFNPSITGSKSEDTFLLMDGTLENITHDPDFPQILVKTDLGNMERPGILYL